MSISSWIPKALRRSQRRRKSHRRQWRENLTPYLSATVLEERRVLNAAPIPVQELQQEAVEIDAGEMADDGAADVFQVSVVDQGGQQQLQVRVNDRVAYQAPVDQNAGITINGSGDDDILIADFADGNFDALDRLVFAGEGGSDQIQLTGGLTDSVTHTLAGGGEGQIQLAGGDGLATVAYTGVESVLDRLTANQRVFQSTGGLQGLTLQDDGQMANGLSRIQSDSGHSISFETPERGLMVAGDGTTSELIRVDGLDAKFDADISIQAQVEDRVQFSNTSFLNGGDLEVAAGEIDMDGQIATESSVIQMDADARIRVAEDASLLNPGGEIHLDAGEGVLEVFGRVDVSGVSAGQSGGSVHLLGDQVGVFGASQIDASGDVGGGEILIGGDFQGDNPLIHNATITYVGTNAQILANAVSTGDGGKVVVWADQATRFYGYVAARGGQQAGNGGFVEVSGATSLQARGRYDLTGPKGQAGTLLFDPKNIQIVGGTADGHDDSDSNDDELRHSEGSDVLGTIAYADEGDNNQDPFLIYESEIEGTDADIVLEARQSITTSGSFSGNKVQLKNNRDLTLRTKNDGADDGGVDLTGSSAGSNLVFATQGTGTITIEAKTIGAGGASDGDIVIGSLQTANQNVAITTNQGVVTIAGAIASGSGDVDINATGNITVDNSGIQTTSGNVDLTTTGGAVLTGEASDSTANVQTTGGAISLTSATGIRSSNSDGFDIDSGAGSVALTRTGVGAVNVDYVSADADAVLLSITTSGAASQGDVEYNSDSTGLLSVAAVTVANSGGLTIANGADIAVGGSLDTSAGGGAISLTAGSTGDIALADVDDVLKAGTGDVSLDASGDSILVANAAGRDEIWTSGTVTLTASSIGSAANHLDVRGAASLTMADTGAGDIYVDETNASTIAATTLTVASATSGTIDIDYFGANVVDVNAGHVINSADLSNATTSSFSYTATTGDITVNSGAIKTGGKAVTLHSVAGAIKSNGAADGTAEVDSGGGAISLNAETGIADGPGSSHFEIASGGGDVSAVVEGTGDLRLSDTGALVIAAAGSGVTTNDGSVFLDTGGQLDVDAVITAGGSGNGITVSGDQKIVISGVNVTTAGGTIDLNSSDVDIDTGAVTVSTGSGAGNIVINGDIKSPGGGNTRDLTLNAGTGDVTLGAIGGASGGTDAINNLDVTAGSTTIHIGADQVTVGDQNYNNAVQLTADVQFISANGNIVFDSTITGDAAGPHDLTVQATNGNVEFSGDVGAGGEIQSIDVDAQKILLHGIAMSTAGGAGSDIDFHNSPVEIDTANVSLGTNETLAGDISIGGAITSPGAGNTRELKLHAGTGDVAISSVGVGADNALAVLDVTGGPTTITISGDQITTGNQDYNSAVVITTDVTFQSTAGDVTFDGSLRGQNNAGQPHNLTLTATSGTVTLSGVVGDLTYIDAIDIDAATLTQGAAITAQGQVDVNVSNALTIGHNLTSGGATNIVVTAADPGGAGNEPFLHTAGTISSTAGTLTIQADDMSLAGSIAAGTQRAVLRSNSNAQAIDLGSSTDASANSLELSDGELDTITAGTLQIGHASAGAINVSAAVGPAAASTLSLTTGSTVGQTAGVTVADLAISASNAVTMGASNSVTNLAIDVASGNIQFVDISDVDVTTVDGVVGVDTDSGSIAITTGSGGGTGDLDVSQNIDAGGTGTITLSGTNVNDNFTLDANRQVITNNGKLSVVYDNMAIDTTGTTAITAGGTNVVELHALTSGVNISLGDSAANADDSVLALSDGELDQVTAAGGLEIQTASTAVGSINIVGAVDLVDGVVSSLHLTTAGGITDTGAAVLTVTSLALSSGSSGIGTSGSHVLVDTGNDTLAATAADGDIFMTESDGTTIGSVTVDGTTVTGVTTTGATGGNIHVAVTNGTITLDEQVNASGTDKYVILDANSTGATADILFNTNSANVIATGDIHLQADDAIRRTAGTTGKVTGDQVFLDAERVGTSAQPILTNAVTLGARTSSAANADVFVDEDDSVTVGIVQDLLASVTFEGIDTTVGAVDGNVRLDVLGDGAVLTIVNNASGADTIRLGTGDLLLIADEMDIDSGADFAVSADFVTLRPHASQSIELGAADNFGNNILELDGTELSEISATDLLIGGGGTTAAISLTADTTAASVTSVLLESSGAIDSTNSANRLIIAGGAGHLALDAATSIGSTNAFGTEVATVSADAAAGGVSIVESNDLTVGRVTVNGVNYDDTTATGAISIVTVSGNLTTSGTGGGVATTGASQVTLTAGGGTANRLEINQFVRSNGGGIQLNATGDVDLNAAAADVKSHGVGAAQGATAGVVDVNADTDADGTGAFQAVAGASIDTDASGSDANVTVDAADYQTDVTTFQIDAGGAVVLLAPTNNHTVYVGDAGGGQFDVSDGEWDRIFADRLEVGTPASTGVLMVNHSAAVAFGPNNVTTLILLSGSSINDNGTGGILTATNLGFDAGLEIGGTTRVWIDATNVAARSDGDVGGSAHDIDIRDVNGVATDTIASTAKGASLVGVTTGDGSILLTNVTGTLTVAADGAVAAAGGRNVTLAAEGATAADNMVVNGDVTVTGGDAVLDSDGNVALYAGHTISTAASATLEISADAAGEVLLAAGTNFNDFPNSSTMLNGHADGDVAMGDGSEVTSEDGAVALLAPDDISLSIVNSDSDTDADDGRILVIADWAGVAGTFADATGVITDNLTGEAANLIGGPAILMAEGDGGVGIGSEAAADDDIDSQLTNLAAETDEGDLVVDDAGGLIIGDGSGAGLSLTLAGLPAAAASYSLSGVSILDTSDNPDDSAADNLVVTTTGALTVDFNNAVANRDGGNVTLAAEGATTADDLTVNEDVTVTGGDATLDGDGNINLLAGDTVLLDSTVTVAVDNFGQIAMAGGTNFNNFPATGTLLNGESTGDVVMADGSAATSEDGVVAVLAPDDVQLSVINSDSDGGIDTDDGSILVVANWAGPAGGLGSGNGIIYDGLTGEAANLTGGSAVLMAEGDVPTGIGDDAVAINDIDTAVSYVTAETNSGDIILDDVGGLTIGNGSGGAITVTLAGSLYASLSPFSLAGITIHDSVDDNSGQDNILVMTSSPLTVDAGNDVVNHDGGNITLAAEGSALTDDVTVNSDIRITGGDSVLDGDGNIALYAGDSIFTAASAALDIAADGAGEVVLAAGTDFNDLPTSNVLLNGSASGDVTMGDGSLASSAAGTVALLAPDDIALSRVDAGTGDVLIIADWAGVQGSFADATGVITDALTGEGANVTGDEAIFSAEGDAPIGIGDDAAADNDIDTQVANLVAETDEGDIAIDDAGGLVIGNGGGGAISVSLVGTGLNALTPFALSGVTIHDSANDNSLADNVIVTTTGPMTVDTSNSVVNNDGGNVTLAAEGSTASDDLTINANVTVNDGNGTLDSDGNIALFAGHTLSTAASGSLIISANGAGEVALVAGTDFNNFPSSTTLLNGNATGDVAMGNGSQATTDSGTIALLAPHDVDLSIADAGIGDVLVIADWAGPQGTFIDSDGAIEDVLTGEAANVRGDQAILMAEGRSGAGIGNDTAADNDIDLAVANLTAETDTGDAILDDVGGLTIGDGAGAAISLGLVGSPFAGIGPFSLAGVTILDSANDNSTLDNVLVTTTGALTVDSGNVVANHDGGNLKLAAEGATAAIDLTVNSNVTVTGGDGVLDGDGNIGLFAGDSIVTAASATLDIAADGAGEVALLAGTNFNDFPSTTTLLNGIPTADITMGDGSTVASVAGTAALLAPHDVALSIVDAGTGTALIVADWVGPEGNFGDTDGAITDGLTGEAANVIGDAGILSAEGDAPTGIGDDAAADNDIDTQLGHLVAETDEGDIAIDDGGGLIIGDGSGGGLSVNFVSSCLTGLPAFGMSGITIDDSIDNPNDSLLDNIIVTTTGPLTVDLNNPVVNNDGGNITLAAEGSAATRDLEIHENVTVTGANAVLDATGNIWLYGGDTINLAETDLVISANGAPTVLLDAGRDYNAGTPVLGNVNGDILAADGSRVEAEAGAIRADAPDNIEISVLNANSDANAILGDVFVTADSDNATDGVIRDVSTGTTGGVEIANIVADEVALNARNGIGQGQKLSPSDNDDRDIDITANTFAAKTLSGEINIEERDSGDTSIEGAGTGLIIGTVNGISGVAITAGVAADDITITVFNTLIESPPGVYTATQVGDLTVNDPVSITGDGNITLIAGDNPTSAADGQIKQGDLNIEASVMTSGSGSDANSASILGVAGDAVNLNPSTLVILQTGTGTLTSIPASATMHVNAFIWPGPGTNLDQVPSGDPFGVDFNALIDEFQIVSGSSTNFRLDVQWGALKAYDLASNVTYQDGGGGALTPATVPGTAIAGSPLSGPPYPYTVAHTFPGQSVLLRSPDPTDSVVAEFTVTFDYRGGTIDDGDAAFDGLAVRDAYGPPDNWATYRQRNNGIQLFDRTNLPIAPQVVLFQQVPLTVPVVGLMKAFVTEEEPEEVATYSPPVHVQETVSTSESTSVDFVTPLPGAAIDPQDHLELWRVTPDGEEVFVPPPWKNGDASPLDDLRGVFRERADGHYRLFLVRGTRRLTTYVDVLIREGVWYPPQENLQVQTDDLPQDAVSEASAPPADDSADGSPVAVDAAVSTTDVLRVDLPERTGDAETDDAGSAATAAAVVGLGLSLHPSQRDWERRADQAVRQFGRGSARRISRLARRALRR